MKSFETLVGKATTAAMRNDRQIKQMISRIVPANSVSHIEFCRVEGGRLRITVDSAAWISRIRFSERQLIDTLRANGFDCHTVSYHVSPAEQPAIRKTIRKAKKARSGAASLEAAAAGLTEHADNSLRQELLKLARKLKSDDT